MEKKLRNNLILGVLAMIIGIVDIVLFWSKGFAVLHLFMGLILSIAGANLLVVTFLTWKRDVRRRNQIKKIEEQNKLYEKDGWESYGGGLHQYRPHN